MALFNVSWQPRRWQLQLVATWKQHWYSTFDMLQTVKPRIITTFWFWDHPNTWGRVETSDFIWGNQHPLTSYLTVPSTRFLTTGETMEVNYSPSYIWNIHEYPHHWWDLLGGIIFRIQIQVMGSEEGGGSFWATFGGGSNGAEVASSEKLRWFNTNKTWFNTNKTWWPNQQKWWVSWLNQQNWWCNGDRIQ